MKRCIACLADMSIRDRHVRCQKCRQGGSFSVKPVTDDYPHHIIEARYLRALWAKNPRMAQAALARMGRAA